MARHADVVLAAAVLLIGLCCVAVDGRMEGNIGCSFVTDLCTNDEWCFNDFVFGKCLPTIGYTNEDIQRYAISESDVHNLLIMLRELRLAGFGWDDPFVQCRMQTAVRLITDQPQREQIATDYQRLSADVADSVLRIVSEVCGDVPPRVAKKTHINGQPHRTYAPGLYGPAAKRQMQSQQEQLPLQQQSPHDRMEEMRKRIELRRMLAEYEAGMLPEPAYQTYAQQLDNAKRSGGRDAPRVYANEFRYAPIDEDTNDNDFVNLDEQNDDDNDDGGNPDRDDGAPIPNPFESQRTSFREVSRELNIPNVVLDTAAMSRAAADEHSNELPLDRMVVSVTGEEDEDDEDIDGHPNEQRRQQQRLLRQRQRQQYDDGNRIPEELYAANRFPSVEMPSPSQRDAYMAGTHRHHEQLAQLQHLMRLEQQQQMEQQQQLEQQQLERLEGIQQPQLQLQFEQRPLGNERAGGVYTEGGLVYVPDEQAAERQTASATTKFVKQMEAANLLNSMLGFTRHERLDVKKPGPLIKPAAEDMDEVMKLQASAAKASKDGDKAVESGHQQKDNASKDGTKSVQSDQPDKSENGADDGNGNVGVVDTIRDIFTPKMKKVTHQLNDHGSHSVDTDYTHVIMRAPIENWSDGPRLVAAIAETLNMKNFLTFSRVDRHEIAFRVEANPQRRSAADIARSINESRTKNNLFRRYGYSVVAAGVGDKTKVPLSVVSVVRAEPDQPDVTYILTYILLGAGVAALLVIIVAVIFVRRSERKRDKLGGLQAGLTSIESNSKDYQDLCRTRMAGKSAATGGPGAAGDSRIFGGLSKENEKHSSSRSSVSSWSDEPATNMDISTGHMVLSYMEDHLKNKGRLLREWEALCRYEAEPSSRDAASKPECSALNRASAPLPYDHSRVLINHLANTDGLDYINASSITDHDPRSAAYIAAQGPLPATLAHFWQMVWEQGSIMIVMLCRLQEMGTISCARYWPEEGSECYDIYEVHLVSEHTTCDDYLVRSFYLKNLRSGETRTVTQFHFLAWPAFGLPAAAKSLLEFRRKVNKSFRGRAAPVIVHSSNGAGRTGSYILLDMVLGRMHKGAREIDIAATLEHLRDQRAGLVATQQQFEFVLMAVAEEVHAILKALPAQAQTEKRELDSDAVREVEADESKRLIDVSESADEDKDVDVVKEKNKKRSA